MIGITRMNTFFFQMRMKKRSTTLNLMFSILDKNAIFMIAIEKILPEFLYINCT